MNDFPRKINEGREPETTAERELQKLLGMGGNEFFTQHFPPEQTEIEVQQAAEWEKYFKENEAQAFAELAIAEFSQKAREEIIYLTGAINYLEESLKTDAIPEAATLASVYSFIAGEAQKLAAEKGVINNPYTIGVLVCLKAIIGLKEEGLPDNTTILDVVKELNNKLEFLKKGAEKKDIK